MTDDTPAPTETTGIEHKGHIPGRKTYNRLGSIEAGDEADSIEASSFVGKDVTVLFEGTIWKLNSDGDPQNPDHWLKRKMWLTNRGGFFYYSKKTNAPLGRPVAGLKIVQVEGFDQETPYAKQYCFEVHPPPIGDEPLPPTTLSTDTDEQRQGWVKCFKEFENEDSGGERELFDTRSSRSREKRKRMNAFTHMESQRPASAQGGQEGICHKPSQKSEANVQTKAIRRDSQINFAEKLNTTLILDWDDTIFPTTWIREDCGLNWRFSIDQQLEEGERRSVIEDLLGKLAERLEGFFNEAVPVSNIAIVTLAKRPWVEQSAKNFLPRLWKIVEDNNFPVIYAQEGIETGMQKEYAKDEFKSEEQVENFWTRVKSKAIIKEVERYNQSYGGQSWKNVISFGDSDFERYGTIAATNGYMKERLGEEKITKDGSTMEGVNEEGHRFKVRTKTVKMLDEPTVEELTAQIVLLKKWVQAIVARDDGFDVEIEDTEDDETLQEMHKEMTGLEESLSWAELAGMASAAS
eukprot:gnl/MRDRNA2_/MRDRNA2_56660_c0_seq1.p1 gnl/MRDRNA2_/MRDRNA2_56660_c0~~gnl/MRDRNA2_/MRDRNA2_56660_c0_seq1.p1  ORF type:complete len:564 (-),score=114.87 gnl/MRDRNA2_/MRDRNA2_56660_c0_seq1:32-1591(-)